MPVAVVCYQLLQSIVYIQCFQPLSVTGLEAATHSHRLLYLHMYVPLQLSRQSLTHTALCLCLPRHTYQPLFF